MKKKFSPVPVLLYHSVTTSPSDHIAPYTVHPKVFAQQLDMAIARGYRFMTVHDYVTTYLGKETSAEAENERVALITFDDGYADFADIALPLLRERNIPSTLYITTGWVNGGTSAPTVRPQDPVLSWDDIAALAREDVEIGSHSHTHPQMDTLDNVAAYDEFMRSKSLLEDATQLPVRSFAYPHGYNSPRLRRIAEMVGYTNATAVRNELSNVSDDPFRIARLMVFRDTSEKTIARWLDGKGVRCSTPRTTLATYGWRSFRRTRAIVTRKVGTVYV